jgi:hypothetical protein
MRKEQFPLSRGRGARFRFLDIPVGPTARDGQDKDGAAMRMWRRLRSLPSIDHLPAEFRNGILAWERNLHNTRKVPVLTDEEKND